MKRLSKIHSNPNHHIFKWKSMGEFLNNWFTLSPSADPPFSDIKMIKTFLKYELKFFHIYHTNRIFPQYS